uniref:FBD domain-containing protein n=1 Tax=Oryza punctata TaxID=4537 RepID=A0A0E0KW20_ORYPU
MTGTDALLIMGLSSTSETTRGCSRVGTEQFRIDFALDNKNSYNINIWVKNATALKTKGLVLELYSLLFGPRIVPYDFPLKMINSNLCCLRIWFASLKVPADLRGSLNLTKLSLRERDNLIGGLPRLISLRHLTLELIICDLPQRKIDMVMICKHTGIVQMMIEGFFGEKDQLELALHILQNANGSQRNDDRHKFEVRICRSVLFARMCCFLWL